MTLARGVVGASLLAILVASGLALSRTAERRSGSNWAPSGAFIEGLNQGQEACQDQELLTADTAAVRVTLGSYGKLAPPVSVRFTGPHGEALTSGTLGAGWKQGTVRIPVGHVSTAVPEARFCIRDDGSRPIALAGDSPDPGYPLQVAGRTVENQRVRVDDLRPGRESWWQLLPTIVHRFSVAKAGLVRSWNWIAVALLMLVAVALASRLLLREDV
jgi:hypothetical protein